MWTSTERVTLRRLQETSRGRTAIRLYYYRRRRAELVVAIAKPAPVGLGYLCDECGAVHHESQLEIDHVEKVTWNVRRFSPQMRVARYWREFKAGVKLRALCSSCNGRDGGVRRWRRY